VVDHVKMVVLIDLFEVHDAPLLIRVNEQDPVSRLRKRIGQVDGDGRFADPSFLIDQTDDHECFGSLTGIFYCIRL
jgi:hypothetical protein